LANGYGHRLSYPADLAGSREWYNVWRMIANPKEYKRTKEELRSLEERLKRLQETHTIRSKGLTKAGIRKMIARLHEELAVYEGSTKTRHPESE
jgi:hypothetical protein